MAATAIAFPQSGYAASLPTPFIRMLAGPYYPRSFTILVIVAMGVLIVPLASGLINGYPVIFLLDTGATDVAIPEALADRLRLQRRRGGVSQTANGPVAVWQTVLDEVGLGSIRLNRIRASILPSMPADSPVLLGMSFLKQLEFTQKDRQLFLRQTGS